MSFPLKSKTQTKQLHLIAASQKHLDKTLIIAELTKKINPVNTVLAVSLCNSLGQRWRRAQKLRQLWLRTRSASYWSAAWCREYPQTYGRAVRLKLLMSTESRGFGPLSQQARLESTVLSRGTRKPFSLYTLSLAP